MSNSKTQDYELEEKFNNLDIVKEINNFETKLAELSRKIGSFDGTDLDGTVSAILESNQHISHHIDRLQIHEQLGEEIDQLEKSRKEIDGRFKDALRKLISYRTELKELPSLPTKKDTTDEGLTTVDVDEVLKYGMKLSKFTKAPPASNSAMQIHPNNFIWPAEDSLRRGMLAMSSLKGDEIVRKELGLDEPTPKPEQSPTKSGDNGSDNEPEQPERRTKRVTRRTTEKTEKAAPALELDLFDPENEDDSD